MDKKWGSSPHKKPKPHVAVYSERAISTNTFVELKKDTFSRFNKYILQFGQKMRQRSPSEAPTTCRCLRAACCCRQIVILNHFYTSLRWQSGEDQLTSFDQFSPPPTTTCRCLRPVCCGHRIVILNQEFEIAAVAISFKEEWHYMIADLNYDQKPHQPLPVAVWDLRRIEILSHFGDDQLTIWPIFTSFDQLTSRTRVWYINFVNYRAVCCRPKWRVWSEV